MTSAEAMGFPIGEPSRDGGEKERLMTTLKDISERHFHAVMEKRIDDIIGRYAESDTTYVFVEGPRWSTIGFDRIARGWRAFVDAPLDMVSCRWVEGPYSQVSGDMGWIAGIVEVKVRVKGEERTVRFRGTFVLAKNEAGEWRIVHEHFSQPAPDPYGIGDWLTEG